MEKIVKCDRCGADLRGKCFTMSRFNTGYICSKCADEERQHPDYQLAVEVKRRMKREKAYANLFAAAPVMYALLKMIADPPTFMGAKTCEELRTAIEAVLKKARGEA